MDLSGIRKEFRELSRTVLTFSRTLPAPPKDVSRSPFYLGSSRNPVTKEAVFLLDYFPFRNAKAR